MTRSRAEDDAPLVIGGHAVAPGERVRLDLPVALLPTHTQLHLPLTVLRGLRPGPRLWVSAAVHGDEINGVEIIRRVLERLPTPLRAGALLAVPIVNVFGFLEQSRNLPDRRDLNRCFPGSRTGSLAARIAHIFMREVVAHCGYGIDLHTASHDRSNLPQLRGDLRDPETRRMAEAFRAPVMLQAGTRDGSLRAAATKQGIAALLFEGGEPRRFDESVIEVGVRGVLGVMAELGMLASKPRRTGPPPVHLESSTWVRARRGGLLRLAVREGQHVEARQEIGTISDPLGDDAHILRAPGRGLVIGLTRNPVVHGGDAVVHLGNL